MQISRASPKVSEAAEKGTGKSSKQHVKTLQADLEEPEEDVATLYQIRSQPGQPLKVEVTLDGKPQWMDHIQKQFISS